jgi:hypothetical protein
MVVLVRVLRVLLTLVLATFVVMFIIGVGQPNTGALEKLALVALIAGCFFLAAQFSTWSARAQAKIRRQVP